MSKRDERRFKWTGRKKYKEDGNRMKKPSNWRLIWVLIIVTLIAAGYISQQ